MARQNFGFGGGANMQQLMRQAQKMQQAMTDAQEKLDAQEYEAQAGGGVHRRIGDRRLAHLRMRGQRQRHGQGEQQRQHAHLRES